jgi:ATP-binding protein involved in chromosome partitioning
LPSLSRDAVLEVLKQVHDPEIPKDIVTLGMVEELEVGAERVRVKLRLTTPACPLKGEFTRRVTAALQAAFGASLAVEVGFSDRRLSVAPPAGGQHPQAPSPGDPFAGQKRFENIRHVVLVGSGKGGVGKSTLAFNLALALREMGARVGLLDGDLYGPSLPILAGIKGESLRMSEDGRILPVEKHGLLMVSLGLLIKDEDAVVWRGPMLHKTIQQFFTDVAWGELDYLLVDLPPGTGDIQLSIAQVAKVDGAVVVTTPQNVAFADVLRAVRMFQKLSIPVLGLVENMSHFRAPDTGHTYWPFGQGRIQAHCDTYGITHLGAIPILPRVAEAGDLGEPPHQGPGNQGVGAFYREVAGKVAGLLSVREFGQKVST